MILQLAKGDGVIVKYEYMVVYSHSKGVGRIQIITEKEIDSYEQVESVDETIRKHINLENIFVIDFKLLRKYENIRSNR